MPGPSPLNSACRCCSEPPNASVSLEYVSVAQSCNTTFCGELPCTSTEAVYDEDENCTSPATTCSPNWADLTRSEKCLAKHYLTITEVDRTGGNPFVNNHGRTLVRQYTIDEDGNCDLDTTCSGSRKVTANLSDHLDESGEPYQDCSGSSSCTETYNTNCSGTTSGSGSGTISADVGGGLCCESTTASDCTSSGYLFLCDQEGDIDKGPIIDNFSCDSFPCPRTFSVTPAPSCETTITYTGANEQGFCTPKTLPSFPAFTQCTPEGEEPPEPPALLEGQGSDSTAYNYTNPYNSLITSKQNIKYRVAHSHSGTCYLKVWFRNKVQKYKYEDCDSGFAGDPPRTATITIDCNPPAPAIQCFNRWSTDGEPTFVEDGTYTWNGSGYPCLADEEKWQGACENIIYSSGSGVKTVTPEENTSVTVEYKYSLIKNYEPDWGDENGCQGCKPNGYPIPNPDDCPVCAP